MSKNQRRPMSSKYRKYIQSKEWKTFRQHAIEAAEHKCQMCSDPAHRFELHHLNYDNWGKEELKDVLVLCHNGHKELHREANEEYANEKSKQGQGGE